jgi:SAM-dependent methyltransferase
MTAPLDPTGRFTDRAVDYAKHRPSYPGPAIDEMLRGLGDPATLVAADIGAGTGISARLLAERGPRVVAIEPNAAMRDRAASHPRVEFRDAAAEHTGLGDASLDLVLCAQSFHWFRKGPALEEFRRILRPGGRLALMWNDRDRSHPFCDAYYRIVLSTPIAKPMETSWAGENPLVGEPGWRDAREWGAPYCQTLDLASLLGRAMSASYVPKSGPEHDRIVRELRDLHGAYAGPDGRVTMRYLTRLFLAERA